METLALIDVETQGLDPAQHKVIEIGCVLWSVRYACVIAAWSDLVQQESNEAEVTNRIPATALQLGLTQDSALTRLRNFVARADLLVAHRAEFDASFLPELGKPWVCSKFDIQWPGSKVGDGLVYVALALGVAVTTAHRALSDCLLLARIFEAAYQNGADIPALLQRAMRPKATFRGMQRFDENQLAKDAGFQWDGTKKIRTRRMAIEDAAALPFPTMRLEQGETA